MPASDLHTRLQRLRVQKVRREIPPPPPKPRPPPGSRAALPGQEVVTRLGAYQLIESVYPADFVHGPQPLGTYVAHDAATAARLAREEALAATDLRSLAFLDTETTGLVGGTGVLVFLVGVGIWEKDAFILRQYFLRDPGQEEALLNALVADLTSRAGWITFNGRAFDLPLLETRLTLVQQRGALGQRPHLDLLTPARRLYRGRLPSCSLGHLEQHVLHIMREQDDVPGELIPQMYLDYLRTGDASDMHRVIYHNAVDILSMVTLAAHLLEVFATPLEAPEPRGHSPATRQRAAQRRGRRTAQPQRAAEELQPADYLRLARWHEDQGRAPTAERAYRQALAGRLSLDDRRDGLWRLAALLKRQDRRAEAVPLWEQLASFTLDDPGPFVELAKYYEWHAAEPAQALAWAERALDAAGGWPRGWRRDELSAALRHRLARLRGKVK